jgi:hypothetical protein
MCLSVPSVLKVSPKTANSSYKKLNLASNIQLPLHGKCGDFDGRKLYFRNIEFSDSIHRPGIKNKTKGNTTFRKLDLFPSSGAGKNPILLGPLERASPNHWTLLIIFIIIL